MRTRIRWTSHRLMAFLFPYRGYKRPRLRSFPDGGGYILAGAYPVRRAERLP